jgi:hypothetical protein
MSDAERCDIVEALFAPKQSREELRDAIGWRKRGVRLWSKTYTV